MKKALFTMLLTFSQFIYPQNFIKSYNYDLQNVKLFKQIVNKTNNNVILVFGEKSKTDFVLFDENFIEKSKVTLTNADNSIKKLNGYSIQNDKYYFYFQKSENEIEVNEIDFEAKKLKTSSVLFQLEDKEKIISSINNQNSYYLITAIKNSNILNLYVFNNGIVTKQILDCSILNLYNSNGTNVNIWDFLSEKNGVVYKDGFILVEEPYNTDIIKATQKKKIFLTNNQIILGTDLNNDSSQYLFVDINKYTISQKTFKKENTNNKSADSNSFFVDDKIFMIKVNGFVTYLTIKDLDDNTLKRFVFSPKSLSQLKNFEPYLESGTFTKRKLLENPEDFFRKLDVQQAAMYAYLAGNKYYYTFGSVSYPKPTGGLGIFGAAGALAELLLTSSSAAISPYNDRFVVYTKDVLTTEFNESSDKIELSNFEKLRTYLETSKTSDSSLGSFARSKNIILVTYNKKETKLNFYKF